MPNVTWTLSYEMVFYLLLAALFSWGVHRRSGWYATAFAVGAVALGGVLPMAALGTWAGPRARPAGAQRGRGRAGPRRAWPLAVLVAVLAWPGPGRPWPALVALVLVTFNQNSPTRGRAA